jgi:hypothetical protein
VASPGQSTDHQKEDPRQSGEDPHETLRSLKSTERSDYNAQKHAALARYPEVYVVRFVRDSPDTADESASAHKAVWPPLYHGLGIQRWLYLSQGFPHHSV